jgi:ATP-dependent DNA helicase RecQ
VLSAAVRTGERFGAAHLADVLTGEATDAVRRHRHDQLKTFGVGKDRTKRGWQTVVRQLYAAGALAEASAEHGGFRLTEAGAAILKGAEISLRVVAETTGRRRRRERGAPIADLDPTGAALFDALRALRLEIARKEGIAAYMIFADRTLIDMARLRPRTLSEMKLVHGVGEAKLGRYGATFLKAMETIPAAPEPTL